MTMNYDDFLNLSEAELEKCQDIIEKLLEVKQQQNFHYLTSFDAQGLTEAFRLDKKSTLPEKAWKYFWENVHPFMLEEKDLPFFRLMTSLNGFDDYEQFFQEENRPISPMSISNLKIEKIHTTFVEEVILNSLKSASAISYLLEDSKLKAKVIHYVNHETHWFYRRFGMSQQALDILIENNILDLTTNDIQSRFYQIDHKDVAQEPGLLACYQAAMRHNAICFDSEHIAQQVVLCWAKAPTEFLEGLPETVTNHLNFRQVVLRLKKEEYASKGILEVKLKTWLPDSYALVLNNHPDNFSWALKLNHDNWNFLDADMHALVKGLFLSYEKPNRLNDDWLFNNINSFLTGIKEENPEIYQKLINQIKEVNEDSYFWNEDAEKILNRIMLNNNLNDKLLLEDLDKSDKMEYQTSSTKFKI